MRVPMMRPEPIMSAKRSVMMPGLPMLAESGLPGFEAGNCYGIVAN